MGNDSFKEIRVVCDSGAQMNLLTEAVFNELMLSRQVNKINVVGINNESTTTRGKVELELWHRSADLRLASSHFVIVEGFDLRQPQQSFSYVPFTSIVTSELADPLYHEQAGVDGIIGVDILSAQIRSGIQKNKLGLVAQATAFGWIVFGGVPTHAAEEGDSIVGLLTVNDVYAQVRKLWEIEEVDEPLMLSAEDQECEQLYQSTVVKKANRYSVNLLLKPNVRLGESRFIARRRLCALEARFRRDPELKKTYVEFMDEYERLGHMSTAELLDPLAPHFYIPHHAVSIDRKFRVVFDGSAKTTNGKSLNDALYVGPRLQKDLVDIHMAFRTGQYAVTADICKMFRQIELQREFRTYQRVLWRRSEKEPVREYWLTVVTYGLASSPYNAVKTLKQCALDNAAEFPFAAHIVQNDFYVDDLLTSVETIEDAHKVKSEVTALLRRGGFELAKWRSSCKSVVNEVNDAKMVTEQDSTSILGIDWNYRNDEFQFKVQDRCQPPILTKRIVTSEAARVFDPQGYVAPITVRAKLFIQQLWRFSSNWDDPLAPELQLEWRNYYEELQSIGGIKIPRWLNTTSVRPSQIHIFCDASIKACGAVAYVRVQASDGWSARLLCSKSKVAPLKNVTIPRLELNAVELGCKLLHKIRQLPMLTEAPVHVWTDSEITLYWLRKRSTDLKMFVANRVSRILRYITVEQSRHIRSEHNPADLLSRGVKTDSLISSQLWWHGPPMLREDVENWPAWKATPADEDVCQQVSVELKKPPATNHRVLLTLADNAGNDIALIDRMSDYRKVCRITAYVIRACQRMYEPIRKKRAKVVPVLELYLSDDWKSDATVVVSCKNIEITIRRLSIREQDNALNYWIKASQKEFLPSEYRTVSHGEPLTRKSQLWQLTPWMDQNGLLRVHGRLNKTGYSLNEKNPIILHRKSPLARLLAEEAHTFLCHGGVQACTQYLRYKYWVVGGRILLRSVVAKCVTCTRYRMQTSQQFMADLPAFRLNPGPVFEHTGVDYAGPISLKLSRNTTSKGYIAVFICMKFKAVQLELVGGLDADSFVAALTRFVNLRAGCVRHMYSDNGSNFVKADRLLREAVEIWQDHEVVAHLESYSIQWHFNVPLAPHHGGIWEAAVKKLKDHLRKMGGAHLFTFEELATLLAKIAACVNSRPLMPISTDPTDVTTLTPGHFITGGAIITPFEPPLVEVPMNRLTAWERIRRLQQDFWVRWKEEYVMEQQVRNKWAGINRSLRVGDLVFLKDDQTPPSQWPMGRVVQVFTGKDGHVRSCEVRTAKGVYDRAVTRLCLLPTEEEAKKTSEIGFP